VSAPSRRVVARRIWRSVPTAIPGGAIVKTVGDAVMAAFHAPADAIKAALAIQDEVAGFHRDHVRQEIVLKLGLHQGACIAVTVGGVLGYFGATVNIASRLEHQCKGGEIILSDAMLAEGAGREVLAGRTIHADNASLRGVSAPVSCVRISARPHAVITGPVMQTQCD
jgi:class 3 adenylate cyclase